MRDQPGLFVSEIVAANPRTRSAYRADLTDYWRFDEPRKFPGVSLEGRSVEVEVPLNLDTVAEYVKDLGRRGAALETVRRRLVALAALHAQERLPDPRRDRKVKEAYKALREAGARRAQRKLAVSAEGVADVVTTLDNLYTAHPAPDERKTRLYLRDRALLLLEFEAGLTRGELASLLCENVVDAGGVLRMSVNRSGFMPTEGEEREWVSPAFSRDVRVPEGPDPSRCAVVAVRRWLLYAAIESGPVFRAVYNGGTIGAEALSPRAITDLHKYWFERAAIGDVKQLSSHSIRSGRVASLVHAGRESEIKDLTGLKSLDTMSDVAAHARMRKRANRPLGKTL